MFALCCIHFLIYSISKGNHRDKTDADLLRELNETLAQHIAIDKRHKTIRDLCESDKIHRLEDVSVDLTND